MCTVQGFLLMRHLKCCESSSQPPIWSKLRDYRLFNLCCMGGLKRRILFEWSLRRVCMEYIQWRIYHTYNTYIFWLIISVEKGAWRDRSTYISCPKMPSQEDSLSSLCWEQSVDDCTSDHEMQPENIFLVEYLWSKELFDTIKTYTAVQLIVVLPVLQLKQTSSHSFIYSASLNSTHILTHAQPRGC